MDPDQLPKPQPPPVPPATLSTYELWKFGVLDAFIQKGIVRTKVIEYCNIYDVYIGYRRAGKTYTEAVQETATQLICSPEKVKAAIAEVV